MPFSLYARNKFLEHIHGKTAFAMPTAYVGFLNTVPNASDGNVTEPSGNGYGRTLVPASSWGPAASGAITNTAVINGPTASGSGWGTIVAIGLFDADDGGNLLYSAPITSQAVPAGVNPSIPVGDADSSFA